MGRDGRNLLFLFFLGFLVFIIFLFLLRHIPINTPGVHAALSGLQPGERVSQQVLGIMMRIKATTPPLPHRGGASLLTQDETLPPEPERLSRHLRAQGLSAVPLVGDLCDGSVVTGGEAVLLSHCVHLVPIFCMAMSLHIFR